MKRKWPFRILKYGLGLLVAFLIFWGFYGFVKSDNWLAVSALATLILAIAAFWAIWQNYSFRKEDRKVSSLKEIRDWANEGLNIVTRIHRLPTTNPNFPKAWEVVACLSYLKSQKYSENASKRGDTSLWTVG